MTDDPRLPGRRNWLLAVLSLFTTITLGFLAFPVVMFLWPRKATRSGELSVVLDERLSQLRVKLQKDEWLSPFNFAGKPCLLVITPDGKRRLLAGESLEENDLKAFNAICTHTDCTVEFRPGKNDIFCACHNGLYNLDGKNVSGPPPRPLEAYKVSLQSTEPGGEKEEIIVSRT